MDIGGTILRMRQAARSARAAGEGLLADELDRRACQMEGDSGISHAVGGSVMGQRVVANPERGLG